MIASYKKVVIARYCLIGSDGNIYNSNFKKIKPQKNGKCDIYDNGHKFGIPKSLIEAQITGVISKLKRIREFPDFFIDDKGNIYNRVFAKKKVQVSKCKGRKYKTVDFFKDGVVYRRYLHKIIAIEIIEEPIDSSGLIGLKDGNYLNCSVDNIYWMNSEQAYKHLSTIQKKRYTNTKDYALKNCLCPILLEYYKTGDIGLINKVFSELDIELINSNLWLKFKGELYEKIMSRLSRYVIMTPIKSNIIKSMYYLSDSDYQREQSLAKCMSLSNSKINKEKRITVDDMEYAGVYD